MNREGPLHNRVDEILGQAFFAHARADDSAKDGRGGVGVAAAGYDGFECRRQVFGVFEPGLEDDGHGVEHVSGDAF